MYLALLLLWFALRAEQDARQRQIANWLTFGGAAIALACLLISGHTLVGAPAAEGGWAFVLAVLFTLPGYALGRLGAGDVKLLAALGLATDSQYLLGTFIGAGVTSLLWLLLRQKFWIHVSQGVANRYPHLGPEASNKQPFAPFLFVGFVLSLLYLR